MKTGLKTALVTGAGRGIGRSIARLLAEDGMQLLVTSRTQSELESLANEIRTCGGLAETMVCDFSRRSDVANLVAKLAPWDVDILVNNAGLGSSQDPRPLTDFDDDFWDTTMEVNVTAPYLLTKALLPGMIERGFGRIINVSSINAKVPALHGVAYTASKHAIAGLTKATANEIAGSGVTANAICPGVTATAMNDLRVQYDADRLQSAFEDVEKKSTPYGRRLVPDEIAPLAKFLASEGSEGINGQLINVCGGTVMAC